MTLPPRGVWLSLALLALTSCGEEDTPGPEVDPEVTAQIEAAKARAEVDVDYELDGRIQLLLAPCPKGGYYDRDTGDPIAILLDKLQFGSSDSLHRTKEELAGMGDGAAREVARLLNRHFDDPMGGAKVQNCIEVLGLMRTPAAHAPLIKCLDHPRDSVRGATLRALATGAALPEDFDRILAHLPVERVHLREQAAIALFAADPNRAAALFLDWLETGTNSDLWSFMANRLPDADPEPLRAKAADLCERVPPEIGLPLAGLALASQDPRPRALLDKFLASENGAQRLPAVSAMLQNGYVDELAELATDDPDSVIRQQVLVALAEEVEPSTGPDKATLDRFHAGLDDTSPEVRKICMGTLLGWRDPAAQDRALLMLGGTRSELQELVQLVVEPLRTQPDFAQRVLERLLELDQDRSGYPLAQRLGILQAIGQVPLEAAAKYLLELARGADGQTLNGLRAFRWLMIQVANTGAPGRGYLATELPSETVPARRLDMIWAISSQRDDVTQDFLLDFVQSDADPYEILFAAERLARSGSTAIVAPVLKRVALRIEHAKVRPALECLLWRWF